MKRMIPSLTTGLVLLLLIAQAGCAAGAETNASELTVFAAASLTGVTGDMKTIFEDSHPGVTVTTNLESSATLETQIREGAKTDLFLPASTKNMDNLEKEGLIVNESITPYATNKLAIIVPADNPAGITGLADLAKEGVKIVSETAEVPVRKYTDQMLGKAANDTEYGPAFVEAFQANIISEETNVAGATTKVALGEADAGITYYSDVSRELGEKVTIIDLPENLNVVASYNAGIVTDAAHADLAREYIALLTSDEGRAVLEEYAFSPV